MVPLLTLTKVPPLLPMTGFPNHHGSLQPNLILTLEASDVGVKHSPEILKGGSRLLGDLLDPL